MGERNSFDQISRIDELDVNDMQLSGSNFGSFNNRMDVEQVQFDGDFQVNDEFSIDFGIGSVEVTNRSQSTSVFRNSWSGVGTRQVILQISWVSTRWRACSAIWTAAMILAWSQNSLPGISRN